MPETPFEERMRLAHEEFNRRKIDPFIEAPCLEGTDEFEEKLKLNRYDDPFRLLTQTA